MDQIGSILPKVLRRRGMYDHVVASQIVTHAHGWIKKELPALAAGISVKKYSHGNIHVTADSSVALLAMESRKDDLLAVLKREIPECPVSSISVRRS